MAKFYLLAAYGVASMLSAGQAVAQDAPWWMNERRIIGENNLESIEEAKGTDAYDFARVVARVETIDGDGFCTSSRVAEDLFLTNHHCFEYKPCSEIQFHLGYERDMPAGDDKIFVCKEVLVNDLSLDYALYRVEPLDGGPDPIDGVTEEYEFTDLGLDIPDNKPEGVSTTFDINQVGNLAALKIEIGLTHDYPSDLIVEITSPAGTTALMHNRSSSVAGSYSSTGRLRTLKGEAASGEWKLTVKDLAAADTGVFESIKFTLTTVEETEEEAAARAEWAPEYPIATLYGGDIQVGQMLLVASHPRARLKEIDRSENCKIRTIVPEIISSRHTITHTCDTEGGSSGSPILDRATGNVVSLHWGGTNEYNLMVPMNMILDHMQENLKPSDFEQLTILR